jgi:hypothetical protein
MALGSPLTTVAFFLVPLLVMGLVVGVFVWVRHRRAGRAGP